MDRDFSRSALKVKLSEMDFTELKKAVEEAELVDAHAHNIVALDSAFPFISCFCEANGDALSYAPHSLSFKVRITPLPFLFFTPLLSCASY